MSSDRIIQRNRQNAQHSTGPRTGIGKSRSSRNALKHGYTGKMANCFDDAKEINQFTHELQAHFHGLDPLGKRLLDVAALTHHRWERSQVELSDLERRAVHQVGQPKVDSVDTRLATLRYEQPDRPELVSIDKLRRYTKEMTRELRHLHKHLIETTNATARQAREQAKHDLEQEQRAKARRPDLHATPYHSQSQVALEWNGVDPSQGMAFLRAYNQQLRQREKAIADKEKELNLPKPDPLPAPAPEPKTRPAIEISHTRNEPRQLPSNHPLRQNPLLDPTQH